MDTHTGPDHPGPEPASVTEVPASMSLLHADLIRRLDAQDVMLNTLVTIVTEFHQVFSAMGANPMMRQMLGGLTPVPATNGADKPPWQTRT